MRQHNDVSFGYQDVQEASRNRKASKEIFPRASGRKTSLLTP